MFFEAIVRLTTNIVEAKGESSIDSSDAMELRRALVGKSSNIKHNKTRLHSCYNPMSVSNGTPPSEKLGNTDIVEKKTLVRSGSTSDVSGKTSVAAQRRVALIPG